MTDGKIIGFDLLPKGKGATITYTDNVEEHGELTYKEHKTKVERRPSHQLETILRSLVGHAVYTLGLSNDKLKEKEFKSRKIVDMPEFKKFSFSGFKIFGDAEEEKVLIKLKLKNINDEAVPLNSGKIAIADGSYLFEEFLAGDMEDVIEEVKSFVAGNNYYKEPELPFPDQKTSKVSEDEL